MKKSLLASLMLAVCFSPLAAKEVSKKVAQPKVSSYDNSRIGVGFNSQLTLNGVNSLSIRYWENNVGFEGILGFKFGDNYTFFNLGGKVLIPIKQEQNVTIYGFGLLGMENSSAKKGVTLPSSVLPLNADYSDTGVTVEGGMGAEFFFSGLPNLGFTTEIGLGYNSTAKTFGTLADWIPSAGIRYYFK